MSEDPVTTLAWLYDSGRWRLAADLLLGESGDVLEDLARAGYSESGERRGCAQEFLRLGPSLGEDCPAARLRLFVGALSERPQCVVWVDGPAGSSRTCTHEACLTAWT
jgi:hypothetical protein